MTDLAAARPESRSTMSVDEAISSRFSVRAFLPDPVSEDTVRHILEVASGAPSGTNMQPWHVYAVSGAAKENLTAEVLAARDRGEEDREYWYYPEEWREPYLSRRRKVGLDMYGLLGIAKGDKEKMWAQFGRNYEFFGAPVGLFFSVGRELKRGSWFDMGLFVQSVMVAARGQGLHTCPQVAWCGYHKVVREVLGIPDEHMLVCGMSLGVIDESDPVNRLITERAPVDEFGKFFGF
ncbi:MAG: nitroreductase [Alphaproteobacteria bacterium]